MKIRYLVDRPAKGSISVKMVSLERGDAIERQSFIEQGRPRQILIHVSDDLAKLRWRCIGVAGSEPQLCPVESQLFLVWDDVVGLCELEEFGKTEERYWLGLDIDLGVEVAEEVEHDVGT